MVNLMLCEFHLIALREFGAVTIGRIDGVAVGSLCSVSGKSIIYEPFDVAVVDITDTVITLRAVRS